MAAFKNRASLSYNGVTVESNETTGEIAEVLSISKTPLLPTYADDPAVFIVSIVNKGTAPQSGLTLTDDMGGYDFNGNTLYPLEYVDDSVKLYIDGALQPAPAVSGSGTVIFGNITIPANGKAILVYAARLTEYAPIGAQDGVTNTAALSGDGVPEGLSASATINAEERAIVSIVKSLSPVTVEPGGTVTYTFVIENAGSKAVGAEDGAVVSDLFTPALSGLSAMLNGTPLEEGTGYSYDEASGQFDTVQGVITVPAATVSQDPDTGAFVCTPGQAVLVVSGTI